MATQANTYAFLGREFLTWLWFETERNNGVVELPKFGKVGIEFERRLLLDTGGAIKEGNTVLADMPTEAAEARTALRCGKKVALARLQLDIGERRFQLTIAGDTMQLSAVRLPTLLAQSGARALAEQLELLAQLEDVVDGLFLLFATLRSDAQCWPLVRDAMREWVSSGSACGDDGTQDRADRAPSAADLMVKIRRIAERTGLTPEAVYATAKAELDRRNSSAPQTSPAPASEPAPTPQPVAVDDDGVVDDDASKPRDPLDKQLHDLLYSRGGQLHAYLCRLRGTKDLQAMPDAELVKLARSRPDLFAVSKDKHHEEVITLVSPNADDLELLLLDKGLREHWRGMGWVQDTLRIGINCTHQVAEAWAKRLTAEPKRFRRRDGKVGFEVAPPA